MPTSRASLCRPAAGWGRNVVRYEGFALWWSEGSIHLYDMSIEWSSDRSLGTLCLHEWRKRVNSAVGANDLLETFRPLPSHQGDQTAIDVADKGRPLEDKGCVDL